jgi:hypothetical protein
MKAAPIFTVRPRLSLHQILSVCLRVVITGLAHTKWGQPRFKFMAYVDLSVDATGRRCQHTKRDGSLLESGCLSLETAMGHDWRLFR